MAREKYQRRFVISALKALDAIAVENPVYPGTPDVNYVEGWIELKSLDKYPKKLAITKVKIPHYTKQQRAWIMKRHNRGGQVFLLLQIVNEWFIFDGRYAALHVGRVLHEELKNNALFYWDRKPTKAELLQCFQKT
jgi:hypothetical protein